MADETKTAEQTDTESAEREEVEVTEESETEEVEDEVSDDKAEAKAEADKAEAKPKEEAKKEEKEKETKPIVYDLKPSKDLPSFVAPLITDEILTFAKAKGLSNEAAQEKLNEASAKFVEAKTKQTVKWEEETKADPAIAGKDGAQYDANIETAKRGVAFYIKDTGNKGILTFFNEDGKGNHPEFVKWAMYIGDKIANDKFVFSKTAPGKTGKSAEEVLYKNEKD